MTSLRQLEANRQNAEKSTGPRSEAGKERSRRNAVRHGLAGEGVVLPDAEDENVQARLDRWRGLYHPATPEEEWIYRQMVVNTVRVDRCQSEQQTLRAYQAERAGLCWDEDRDLEAEETAAALSKRPQLVAKRLTRTSQGCDWLISRWRKLAESLENGEPWTAERESLALDLQGEPLEFRDRPPHPDPAGRIAREIRGLQGLQTVALDTLDEHEQDAARRGRPVRTGRVLERLERYEAACFRLVSWARNRLLHDRPASAPNKTETEAAPTFEPFPEPIPFPTPPPGPAPLADPAPPPPPAPEPVVAPKASDRVARDLFGRNTPADLIAAQPAPPRGTVSASRTATPGGNRQARRAAMKLAGRR